MPTETTTQLEQTSALLEQAEQWASQAATALTDVVSICTDEADGRPLAIEEAHALLGRAYVTRRSARWAVAESDAAIKQLVFQVQLAEEHVEFARTDAENGDDA